MTKQSDIVNDTNYLPVLDQGFAGLIDHMGNDASIVQAARVSYGKGTKTPSEDRGLIRYLMRHHHSTPIEMVMFKFHIKVPIFVMRQHIRHRMSCLAGSNDLWFSLPASRAIHKVSISKFYKMWHGKLKQKSRGKCKSTHIDKINENTTYTVGELAALVNRGESCIRNMIRSGLLIATTFEGGDPKLPSIFIKGKDYIAWAITTPIYNAPINSNRLGAMKLRMLNEDTGLVETTSVTDVWKSGKKKLYKVTVASGNTLKLSANHLCYTDKGWLRLKEFVNLKTGEASAKICIIKRKSKNPFKDHSYPIDIDLKLEKWRWIPGLENDYKVSNYGRVKSYKWGRKTIKQATVTKDSYNVVSLQYPDGTQKVKFVQQLVALAWLSSPTLNNVEICHANGNRQDNTVGNISWGTSQNNSDDMIKHDNAAYFREKFVEITDFKYIGIQQTYDLSVSGPFHNFVTNSFVVHNSTNEYSGRYSEMTDEFYMPEINQIMHQSTTNKQGRIESLVPEHAEYAKMVLDGSYKASYAEYLELLPRENVIDGEFPGIARESARMVLPVSNYTEAYWKIDLHNLFRYLNLRQDLHAQYEIRMLANAMYELIKPIVPIACEAYIDYVKEAYTASRMEVNFIKAVIATLSGSFDAKAITSTYGMSARELTDFSNKFGLSLSHKDK